MSCLTTPETKSTAALPYLQNVRWRTKTLFEQRKVEKLQESSACKNLSQAVGEPCKQKAVLILLLSQQNSGRNVAQDLVLSGAL